MTNRIYFFLLKTTVLTSTLVFLGCGAKENDKIGDAQGCLDQSPLSEVETCTSSIEGLESPKSYEIRCAAKFIREGYSDPTKYSDAFSKAGSSGSYSSFMNLLTFTSQNNIATDTERAHTAFDYCLKSEAKGSVLISAFTYFTMGLYNFMYTKGVSSNCKQSPPYDLSSCLSSLSGSANGLLAAADLAISTSTSSPATSSEASTLRSAFGSVIVATYNASCSVYNTNDKLCSVLKSSIENGGGATNLSGVGTKFFYELIKSSCSSCGL